MYRYPIRNMYRRRRRRSMSTRPVLQTYKQVVNIAPASVGAGVQTPEVITNVVDNYTGPSVANTEVPTGAIIEGFDIQISLSNLVSISSFVWITIQQLRSGQSTIDNQFVGGNPQRNQVFLQLQRSLGKDQNRDIVIPFKIPKKFQRCREGDSWRVCIKCDTIRTQATQIIYKFKR